ncbi:MAG: tRNA (cytidine(34)-2'-O)-methyltransferase [Hydrogenophilus sp.]|nr:tRNA (cytidine(34)-2'-O)-methyltransferase [Hydrogenophilus sp.]
MFHVVLVEPEIPQNTGNVIRLCANTGATLHLVRPLGFIWGDRHLRRAGLDYHEWATVHIHPDFAACRNALRAERWFLLTTQGAERYDQASFLPGDVLVFGSESRGVDAAVSAQFSPRQRLRVPMRPGQRSLNLANTVALVLYEAWRQNGFAGGV